MNRSFRREFDSVDRTADPTSFVDYLDTTRKTEFFQEIKRRTFDLMDLHEGESAVDIGCGTGEDVLALAARISPSGRAVGVDISSTMITAARQRAARQANVEFVQADVRKLPFKDACFDAARAERILQHTRDPNLALGEIVRIAKPQGRIVIWEADLDLFIIDAPDYDTSRVMQRFICDSFQNGYIGHRLYKCFLDFRLADVQSIPLIREFTDLALIESAFDLSASVERAIEKGLLQSEPGLHWLESLRSASRAGQFFSAIGGFITFGRKTGQ
jgi:ubiquinone/menaquinone biosynthesis C-methylase UbiE